MGAVMRYQPQGRASLSRPVPYAYLPSGPTFVNVGPGGGSVTYIGNSPGVYPKGRGVAFSGGGASVLLGTPLSVDTGVSIVIVFSPAAAGVKNSLVGLQCSSGTQLQFATNSANGLQVDQQQVANVFSTADLGIRAGGLYVAGLSYTNNVSMVAALDGRIVASTSTNIAGNVLSIQIARRVGDLNEAMSGGVLGVFVFNERLPNALLAEYTANPWQLFRAPERRILVASGAPAGTDTPVNPGAGSVAFTGYAPSIAQSANQSAAPGAGSLGITGYAPTVAQSINGSVAPGAGSVAITGYAPTITQPQAVAPNVGSLTITGYAPTVTQAINQAVNPNAGSLALTGYAPSVGQSVNQAAAPGAGSVALTGYAPAVAQSAHQGVTPDAGSLTVTGYAPSVVQESASRTAQPGVGLIEITGYAPSVFQSGAQVSGGFPHIGRTQSSKEREEERERLGIVPKKVERVIAKVAKRQVVDLKRTQEQAEAELKHELARTDTAYKAFYARMLEDQREQLVQQEIAQLMRKAEEEDDEAVSILLLM
jgi:hypothetical protein